MSSSNITDYLGNSFESKNYIRIVSLVPSITELLFDFGLEKQVVGVTKFCVSPEIAMKTPRFIVGGTKNPDIDLIEELRPDLVIINKEENRFRHYNQLVEKNLSVFVTYPKSVKQSLEMINTFVKLFQIKSKIVTQKISELDSIFYEIQGKVKQLKDSNKTKVFCPIWKDPWMTINEDTYISSIIEFCGGQNIFASENERYPKIILNSIFRLDPDVILLPDEPFKFEENHKKELQTFSELKNAKIFLVDGTFHWYSFAMIKSLPMIYKFINGKSL